jgi:hypothetical protein
MGTRHLYWIHKPGIGIAASAACRCYFSYKDVFLSAIKSIKSVLQEELENLKVADLEIELEECKR